MPNSLLPALLLAHPGHGVVEPDSALHYIAEPAHAVLVMTAVALAFGVLRAWRGRRREKR